uniref:Uncharacterized protein n=1 Tax=Ixodes ricinus TaxID=34613 RepID=A0A6B0UFJ8_IXORI
MPGQAVFFLQLGIQQVQGLCKLGWAALQTLLKKVTSSFQLGTTVTLEELCEVGVPNVVHVWPLEEGNALFVGFEGFFEVVVLFQEKSIVDDDLWGGDL